MMAHTFTRGASAPAANHAYRSEIADLCRFESLKSEAGKLISLREYIGAMPADQREIFYLTAPTRRSAEEGPHLEALKRRGYDVLLLTDPVDEWVVQSLTEFDKRRLKSAAHGDVDLGDESDKKAEEASQAALAAVKSALGDKVKDVRFSRRLTDSASCLIAEEGDPSANMQRIMKMLDATAEEAPRILELNPAHPIIQSLSALAAKDPGAERIKQWSSSFSIRRSSRKGS